MEHICQRCSPLCGRYKSPEVPVLHGRLCKSGSQFNVQPFCSGDQTWLEIHHGTQRACVTSGIGFLASPEKSTIHQAAGEFALVHFDNDLIDECLVPWGDCFESNRKLLLQCELSPLSRVCAARLLSTGRQDAKAQNSDNQYCPERTSIIA